MRLPLFVFLAVAACGQVSDRRAGIDGLWLSEGYGNLFEISADTIRSYEVSRVSCLPSFVAAKVESSPGATAFRMVDGRFTFLFLPDSAAPDRARFHVNGTASDMFVRRAERKPPQCDRPTPDTPRSNFETFVAIWREQYPFFELKGADWDGIAAANREAVTDSTPPERLFEILRGMFEPFEDAHTFLVAESLGLRAGGRRLSPSWVDWPDRERAHALVERYLTRPLAKFNEGQLEFGMLGEDIGYLRIRSFGRYHPDGTFESGLTALEATLDTIFTGADRWIGMVIDVRINTGGADPYGLAIAARLTDREYVAYAKQARSDPYDPSKWTAEQPSVVRPSPRPGFRGPVVELIGIQSISAAETFTQALFGRRPAVVRIGGHTQGVFSDVLGRRLPNGWRFGLPNERFVTEGRSFDGPGIPAEVEVESFTPAGIRSGRDAGIERAMAVLRAR